MIIKASIELMDYSNKFRMKIAVIREDGEDYMSTRHIPLWWTGNVPSDSSEMRSEIEIEKVTDPDKYLIEVQKLVDGVRKYCDDMRKQHAIMQEQRAIMRERVAVYEYRV